VRAVAYSGYGVMPPEDVGSALAAMDELRATAGMTVVGLAL
jgi:hypothetical protein